jgi:HAD superfamily hydrolase (TIGR01549 family)
MILGLIVLIGFIKAKGMVVKLIKAILLDFYGTIAIYGNMEEADEKVGKIIYDCLVSKDQSIEYTEFINKWNNIFSLPITLEEKTEDTIFLTKLSKLFKEYSIYCEPSEICDIGESCLSTWRSYISFPADIHKTFEFLRSKYALALVSNFDHPKHLRMLLEETAIKDYFNAVAISGEIGINKPDARIFEKIMQELNVKPHEVIFIGDSINDDINGAQKVGCNTILIDMCNRFENYNGNKISKLSDLLTYKIDSNRNA